ncbi:MAG TPA: hypothetical protein VFR23_10195 [Jiangellaceae bacterium]|nr:hypothetical protein [Jiangellaceae bacterium]
MAVYRLHGQPVEEVVRAMTVTSTKFSSRLAPCGRMKTGEHYETRDDQGLATDQMLFDCGCRASREEYHDGSIEYVVVRHDGKLLNHETVSEHGA